MPMKSVESLAKEIMAEAKKDGDDLTWEEALQSAEWELKAKGIKNYVMSDVDKKEKKPKEKKIDTEKVDIISFLADCMADYENAKNIAIANPQKEITFLLNGNEYSISLIKHRPKKD